MSPQSSLLQTAVEAIKQRRYAEAVQALETFCRDRANRRSKDYVQAQMWLVKAYQENGQGAQAITLCRQMAESQHPQIRAWAERVLPTLDTNPDQPPPPTESAPTSDQVGQTCIQAPSPSTPPDTLPLSEEQAAELLKTGSKALRLNRFAEAIPALETYCRRADPTAKDYSQAQQWLVKAYRGNGQTDEAIALTEYLLTSEKEFIRIWAQRMMQELAPHQATAEPVQEVLSGSTGADLDGPAPEKSPQSLPKAGRSLKQGVKLGMKGIAGNLALASGITISLLFGMILVLSLSLLLIVGQDNPTLGLMQSILITIIFSVITFFISPIIMDWVQVWLYGTRWISLYDIERQSPEAARVIRTVCQQKKLSEPRFGLILDQNPTAFTYGSLPGTARLVVSQGLFTYLDEDEIATVYAHELGHIVHWDFAVMTLASTLVQITYLIYVYTREMANKLGNGDAAKKIKGMAQSTAIAAYVFYLVGEYLVLYLSRTREYYADHFAAEVTGNPNALSRALIKIAYGILEEGKRNPEPSKVIQGTRALGICDPRSAAFTGTAYRVATEPAKVGRVFLWDMFNPWAWWMELSSTHPLTGKRVRALSTYAEQLGLETEFDMALVVREGRSLNKKKLYGNFVLDLFLYRLDLLGLGAGLAIGLWLLLINFGNGIGLVSLSLIGFGVGTVAKTFIVYPDFKRAPATDIMTVMSDPYASPLRGRPVKLTGEIIGRGDAGNKFGSDLKLQDATGMIFLRYSSRFGPLGNFLFGMSQADSFMRQQVDAVGWFRRGIAPWVDLILIACPQKWNVNSYHRFWSLLLGFGAIALGFVIPTL